MADKKISQLTDGGALRIADQIPVNRGGANFRVVTSTDILWADLLTAIGGSTLTPLAWYHITDAPDVSGTISEAWVRAKDANEIFPDGQCIINAANITNRLAQIKFFMAGGNGGKIAGVYDTQKNAVEAFAVTSAGTSSTANIDAWLNLLAASNQSVKIYGSVLGGGASGTISNYSELFGATMQIAGGSTFYGVILDGGSAILDNGSNANGVYVLGTLNLDNATVVANGYVGLNKNLVIADGNAYIGFSTEGNTALQTDGLNPSGDVVTVDAATGTLYIVDGATDITINMPTGLINGQRMDIVFKTAQSAITWGGAPTDANFFPATSPGGAPFKISAVWVTADGTWR